MSEQKNAVPIIRIDRSFYCPELNEVIHAGIHENLTEERFELLKPRAAEIYGGDEEPEKSLEEMTVKELREIAAELKIANYANLKKAELLELIEEAKADSEDDDGDGDSDTGDEEPETSGDPLADQEMNINVE